MGPVGLPRDEVSTHGDDGSLRLLAAPAVLVVVVLLLLVTACSAAGGEESGSSGDGGDATPAAAAGDGGGDDDADGDDDAEGDDGAVGAGGQVQPAEVTEDGRMLQPNGHQGIWFETAPGDPLGKLVYESQRFVGDPVELELLGDRALMPEWADMPDLCTGEILERLKALGFREVDPAAIGTGVVACGGIGEFNPSSIRKLGDVNWGTVAGLSAYGEGTRVENVGRSDFVAIDMSGAIGCNSFVSSASDEFYFYSSTGGSGGEYGCQRASSLLQALLNVIGEKNDKV